MSYRAAIRYLDSLVNYEKLSRYPYPQALNLSRFRRFLDSIDNPQNGLKCIHVAGTKGKGSTAAFLTYILREAGFRVGLFTSPHLTDFRERIRVLEPGAPRRRRRVDFEGMIPESGLTRLVNKLKPAMERYNRVSKFGPLTFFEAFTAVSFAYFKEKKTDIAVLETGLGGRLDSTNVVNPLVSVITPISYEHTDKLGCTLKKIASEKAGIIKKGAWVVSAPQKKEALEVIKDKCKKERARLLAAGKEIKYGGSEEDFSVTTPYDRYGHLKTRLIGPHQVMNAASAVAAVNALREYGINVSVAAIKKGLYNTLWPGRCEVAGKRPLVVLDGAQNVASAAVLKKAIREKFRFRRLILVLGVSNDKDIKGIAAGLSGLAAAVILTRANTPRASEPSRLKEYFTGKDTYVTLSVQEAKELGFNLAGKEDLILVTGSLYVVGEWRAIASGEKNDKSRDG